MAANCKARWEKVKSEYIDPDKLKFILDLMMPDNANAVRVSLITGLRIGDVLALKQENVDQSGAVRTICDKTSKPFEGEIPSGFARELKRRAGKDSVWLFPSPSPRRIGKPRTRQAVWRDIKRAAKICAVPRNVTPHSARKVYAVDKFKKNGLEAAQTSLQHDRLSTTLIYAFSDQIAAAAARDQTKPAKKTVAAAEVPKAETPIRSADEVEQILDRFYDAFGGREAFAHALAEFVG